MRKVRQPRLFTTVLILIEYLSDMNRTDLTFLNVTGRNYTGIVPREQVTTDDVNSNGRVNPPDAGILFSHWTG